MQIPQFDEIIEPNDQTRAREEHLAKLRELVGNVYPNQFLRSRVTGGEDTITRIVSSSEIVSRVPKLAEGERPSPEIKDASNAELKRFGNVRIAGRLATPPRLMGKAAFVHLSDGISRLQIYVRKDDVRGVYNGPEQKEVNGWELFSLLDHGDFIGVEGFLFITNTGELSVHVETVQFLSKAMLPMPDKMHGIEDPEIKQRQRYVDLIGSSLAVENEGMTTREVFEARAKLISSLRRFLEDHGYIEVETPMLTPKATGAAAKPFVTHHNALDITLYARIAPELYLKRLVVGGFEKVYELNRNFRNEGISYKHNPEFTMLEFYCAYMDVHGMMDVCEKMLRQAVKHATGDLVVDYKGKQITFEKFERISMTDAILRHIPVGGTAKPSEDWFRDREKLKILYRIGVIAGVGVPTQTGEPDRWPTADELWEFAFDQSIAAQYSEEKLSNEDIIIFLFEHFAEPNLIQPTFIIDYPKSISPLSKASPGDPRTAERFELFINGMEVANGFSELNDPREQYERFVDQMAERERGDEEAMILDEDYIRALSYGMPPTAGIGIGVDRLTMLLTNRHSIRDVILFPHMRPEKRDGENGRGGEADN
jgi:lysyl-tRNA synthetase class 2